MSNPNFLTALRNFLTKESNENEYVYTSQRELIDTDCLGFAVVCETRVFPSLDRKVTEYFLYMFDESFETFTPVRCFSTKDRAIIAFDAIKY